MDADEPRVTLTLDDVKRQMETGRNRLRRLGFTERDVEARLRWKEDRGIDTTVERRLLGLEKPD